MHAYKAAVFIAVCTIAVIIVIVLAQDFRRISRETRKRELLLKLRKAERAVEHCAGRKLANARVGSHANAEWFDKCLTVAIADQDTLKAQYEREFGTLV